jgi:MFS family permease
MQWQPSFFIRSFGLTPAAIGGWFAAIYGAGGLLGTYVGGAIATRFAKDRDRLQLLVIAGLYVMFGLVSASVYVATTPTWAFAFLAVSAVGGALPAGPIFAMIQSIVPHPMRAVAVAIIYLFSNLIGLGLGPLVAGVLSEFLRPALGSESLRYALLILCPGYAWAAFHLWRASGSVERDIRQIGNEELNA